MVRTRPVQMLPRLRDDRGLALIYIRCFLFQASLPMPRRGSFILRLLQVGFSHTTNEVTGSGQHFVDSSFEDANAAKISAQGGPVRRSLGVGGSHG